MKTPKAAENLTRLRKRARYRSNFLDIGIAKAQRRVPYDVEA